HPRVLLEVHVERRHAREVGPRPSRDRGRVGLLRVHARGEEDHAQHDRHPLHRAQLATRSPLDRAGFRVIPARMSRIYRELPPKGNKVGMAFSGGLDTRCAVAWMSRQGVDVYAYTADLAQPDEKDPNEIPPVAMEHGAKAAKILDCRESMVREGLV